MVITKKNQTPSVYIRVDLPETAVNHLKEICPSIVVEPWNLGDPEPEPTVDVSECEVLFTLGFHDNLNILKKAKKVKWVHSLSVGLEAMLTEDVLNSDLIITNAKGCTSVPIAEHTIAMISSLARGVPTLVRNQIKQDWGTVSTKDLSESTVCIIGYGDIGYEIAKRCKAFDMHVIGCRRNPTKKDKKNDPADLVVGMDQVEEVLSKSDFVVVALPSTKDTNHFINKKRFNAMKEGSYFFNVGRGNTVVENDLMECLRNGKIAGAGLDVFEVEPLPKNHPLWQYDNVIVSPHNAYNSNNHLERVMGLFLKNLKLFYEGKPLINVIDKTLGY